MKGKAYKRYVKSAVLYGSKRWCLRENEVAIRERAQRSMVRAMCGVKLMDKRNTWELMDLLRMKEAAHKLARVNGVRWYGHVFIKEMLNEVDGKCKQGLPRMKWREQVEGNMRKKDVADQ